MPQKTVEITAQIANSYSVELKARDHVLTIDQPPPVGQDAAPTPLEYFSFSLGGCFRTIARQVAQQRKIKLRSVEAKIQAQINTDFLLGKTDDGRAGFTEIKIITKLDADLDQKAKDELVAEVEKRCPIADNIINMSNMVVEVQ